MFRVIYKVTIEERAAEEEWLRAMLIVPALEIEYDWATGKQYVKFGMIIPSEQLTLIKLRHNIDMQLPYTTK